MKQSIFRDSRGKFSSKRVGGYILLIYAMVLTYLDGYKGFDVDASIIITMLAMASAMLSLDSVTDIWKQNKNNNGTIKGIADEPN